MSLLFPAGKWVRKETKINKKKAVRCAAFLSVLGYLELSSPREATMSATMDLLVMRRVRETEEKPLYEGHYLLTNFTDSAGAWAGPGETPRSPEKGTIFEALLGDGPERHGLKTFRWVVLVDAKYVKNRTLPGMSKRLHNFSDSGHIRTKKYLIERNRTTEAIHSVVSADPRPGRAALTALRLAEFLRVVSKIPRPSNFWLGTTVPMVGFLREISDEDRLVIPIVGTGLSQKIERVRPYSITNVTW